MTQPPTKPDLSGLRIHRDESPPAATNGGVKKGRLWIWVTVAVGIVVIGAFVLWQRGSAVVEVRTAAVQRLAPSAAQSLLTATGYVVAQRQAAVASKGAGRLEILNVEEGDQVKTGDIIARLEAADVTASHSSAQAKVAQAEANWHYAQATAQEARLNFDRIKDLRARNLASQSEFDNAEARFKSANASVDAAAAALKSERANLDWAQVQVENTYIRAPFDGTVLSKHADVGEVVAPFASSVSSRGAVVTIADMSSLEVEADVSESNIQRIILGQPCLITLDALPSEPYRGRVKKIVPTADRAKATVLTKIAFDQLDARVLPEMSAKVHFLPETTDASSVTTATVLSVPADAVVQRSGQSVVFVVRQKRVHATTVTVGQTYGVAVEIKSGVQEGEIVVLNPPPNLSDGDETKLAE